MTDREKGQRMALALGQLYLRGRYDYLTNHRGEMTTWSALEREFYQLGRTHERTGVMIPENLEPSDEVEFKFVS
jgi:hypothetical protein